MRLARAEQAKHCAEPASLKPLFVMGGGVQGGRVVSDWPGLAAAQLFEQRDLAVTTDVRSVLAECLAAADFRASAADVFPGFAPRRVGLFG